MLGVPIFGDKTNVENSPFRQGKVVAPHRMANPWLLFDWIYKLTENATAELNQKKNLDDFTRAMIKKRREALRNDENPERKSLLDYMLLQQNLDPEIENGFEYISINKSKFILFNITASINVQASLMISSSVNSRFSAEISSM